jgi:hypothetical protein
MMIDKKKEIQLYNLEDNLIPRPNRTTLQFQRDEIERLTKELTQRHKQFAEMSDQLDKHRIRFLEKFRLFFMYHCIVLTRDIDLLTCRDTIAEGRCTFHKSCKPRKSLIEKLHLSDGDKDLSDLRNPPKGSPPIY